MTARALVFVVVSALGACHPPAAPVGVADIPDDGKPHLPMPANPPVLPLDAGSATAATSFAIPEVYVRSGADIVRAPEADQTVAKTYNSAPHGDFVDGARLTLLVARSDIRVGDTVRILHVVEVQRGHEAYVMGPKPVHGEIVDGVARTQAAVNGYPDIDVYDGAVVPGPALDANYEITTYTFDTPGKHTIEWRFGANSSNQLVFDVK